MCQVLCAASGCPAQGGPCLCPISVHVSPDVARDVVEAAYRAANSTEDDGIGLLRCVEGFVSQGVVVCVYRALSLVSRCVGTSSYVAYTTEQVLLEVERDV